MLNWNISHFEKHVDPDQLASKKPADQDPHCFPLYSSIHARTSGILKVNWMKFVEEWCILKHTSHKEIQFNLENII